MSQESPVPRLDLAPKLQRPLSLWKPLDYLLLLYWVFFFPQALRWYVGRFGGGYIPPQEMNWRKGWQILNENPVQRGLFIQGLILTVVTPFTLCLILEKIGVSVSWGGVAYGVAYGVAFGVAFGVAGGVAFGVAFGVAYGVAFGVAGGVGTLRPENWLLCFAWNSHSLHNSSLLPRITPLPLPKLSIHLQKWLAKDWQAGVDNANQLLAYTLQFMPVITAVNKTLEKTPPKYLIGRVSSLAENPFDWQLVFFASALFSITRLSQNTPNNKLRLDTPARAAAAGFWHLHKKRPDLATKAFSHVCSLPHGEEMYTLAETLSRFQIAQEVPEIGSIEIPIFPQGNLLRPTTWQTLTSLVQVIENVRIIQQTRSPFQRSSALNRALGELTNILDEPTKIPQAERDLIIKIAERWQLVLLEIATKVGEITITQRIGQPYVVGPPVEGHLFVGRGDIMGQLQELWMRGNQLQSVVIYGHRRMGKTSILRNADAALGEGVELAYINLQEVADGENLGDILIAISDAVARKLQITPPADGEFVESPTRTFKRYLQQVQANLNHRGLIIALDEFEKIEDFIQAGKIPPTFMEYLRSLVQMSPKIAFALAGAHTLEEMTTDYFQPFYASVVPPIHVSFMTEDAVAEIIANPGFEDFPLDYTPGALKRIYTLTHGQPYLVQLLGFQLVRLYNYTVFECREPRQPRFTESDVDVVVENPAFFQDGGGYFEGVWGQAGEYPSGQREILMAIARHPEGLTVAELTELGVFREDAFETLKRHDVIWEIGGRSQIIVELFRRWVVTFKL
ncbi:AAA family ATPase [Calothrix sp. 336/3]|uniref:AAA family ATPase n=1 Tax=Calothrix sp. 336/3 TaxID=1337936 RepID=UPI000624C563|nr:ATP-binding protein [Calothrix sp. 336/3]AKG24034.1 ATPase [Calothrix sp. 336/3]